MPIKKRRRTLRVTVMVAAGAMLIAGAGATIAEAKPTENIKASSDTLFQQAAAATAGIDGQVVDTPAVTTPANPADAYSIDISGTVLKVSSPDQRTGSIQRGVATTTYANEKAGTALVAQGLDDASLRLTSVITDV
jgi:hypothetical protein